MAANLPRFAIALLLALVSLCAAAPVRATTRAPRRAGRGDRVRHRLGLARRRRPPRRHRRPRGKQYRVGRVRRRRDERLAQATGSERSAGRPLPELPQDPTDGRRHRRGSLDQGYPRRAIDRDVRHRAPAGRRSVSAVVGCPRLCREGRRRRIDGDRAHRGRSTRRRREVPSLARMVKHGELGPLSVE
jgi:hypothetical protein